MLSRTQRPTPMGRPMTAAASLEPATSSSTSASRTRRARFLTKSARLPGLALGAATVYCCVGAQGALAASSVFLCVPLQPKAVGPLRRIAAAKLAALLESDGHTDEEA